MCMCLAGSLEEPKPKMLPNLVMGFASEVNLVAGLALVLGKR